MARRIGIGVDAGAAALLAGALLYSGSRLGLPLPLALVLAAIAFLLGFRLLGSVDGTGARHALGDFPLAAFPDAPELLLDDVLAAAGPDSRVVRLFDPAATPSDPPLLSADASQALYDAFAELRRSLR